MADITPFIPGLSGEEIVLDLLTQIGEKLRGDCNLRGIDQYSGGYKATISGIHIECFGLDQATADYSLKIENTTAGQDGSNAVDFTQPDPIIDTDLEIPVETDLGLVRERSEQVVPDFEMKPVEITPEGPVLAPQGRRYTRRVRALAQATGGATGPLME